MTPGKTHLDESCCGELTVAMQLTDRTVPSQIWPMLAWACERASGNLYSARLRRGRSSFPIDVIEFLESRSNRRMNMKGNTSSMLMRGTRIALAVLVGLVSLPYLIFGAYLLRCWISIHASHLYYVDYPHVGAGLGFIGIGLACLGMALFSAWRRSFYGVLYMVLAALGLFAIHSIPEAQPHITRSMLADSNYIGDISSYFRVWYESHNAFPADESEFAQAMAEGPAEWRDRATVTPESQYKKLGHALPYQVLVFSNATGPRVENLADRPGVIYYCVSGDLQKFWATMTGLNTDFAQSATIKRVADLSDEKPLMAKGVGSDYPRDEKALDEYREKMKADPAGYRHPLAETLTHLGVVYAKTKRPKEAEEAYKEALKEYRELAKTDPSWYSPNIASTMNSLGDLYGDTARLKESADAYTEALQIRRELVRENWGWYAPGLAATLNSLGRLCARTQRLQEAVNSYTEALGIRRELAKANSTAYLPDLAATLNNLGALYKSEGRNEQASHDCEEAATIYRQLLVTNPNKYGPLLGSICAP
jgi:tetratricopeptide (TPR) repeat protein